jgi:peptidoglycan/xylan/chitin deacetylase (PgdA/CDA1 family)
VSAAAVFLAAPALWAAYTWGSHALTLGCVWRGPREGRKVSLTFDDGPDPETTPRVLDILAAQGVRGTFFLIGARAARHGSLVRRIADSEHDLGNHSWSHRSLWLAGPRQTAHEVTGGHEGIAEVAGTPPRFFRPPWGMTNLALFPVLRRLGTPCVFWTVQTEGRRAAPAPVQIERVRRRALPGAILDLHDADGVPGAGRRLVEALPSMIHALRADGYTLVPLSDLL